MKVTSEYVFFYREWLSNYAPFELKISDRMVNRNFSDITWTSTEQMFMAQKARYFKDYDTYKKIISTSDPGTARRLGRQVKNYDDNKWSVIRYHVFWHCNYIKYTMVPYYTELLLDSDFNNKKFVEASPIDRIWGIGFDENTALNKNNINNWGQNLLGTIITDVRNKILNGGFLNV